MRFSRHVTLLLVLPLLCAIAAPLHAQQLITSMTVSLPGNSESFGRSVANAGDVNGDGFDDMIVGAGGVYGETTSMGYAYIYFGGSPVNATPDVVLKGEAENNFFGFSVAGAGDVNKDGYDDVVVGAYGHGASANTGKVYVFFGGASMDSTADVTMTGSTGGDWFGYSVAGAGDVNNDTYDDVLVGANRANGTVGAVYIFYGGASMDGTAEKTFIGEALTFDFGISVAGAGDINIDGYDDIVVGQTGYDNYRGRAFVFFGGDNMDTIADVTMTGQADMSDFGFSVAGAGKVNGDGYADVVVGAKMYGAFFGRAYVYFGDVNMDDSADVVLTGAASSSFGWSVAGAGDVNHDGYDDIIVGAPTYSSSAGRAFVYYGGSPMNAAADVVMTGILGSHFGEAVSGGGDVTGDLYDDVIIGARSYNPEGRAYLVCDDAAPMYVSNPNYGNNGSSGDSLYYYANSRSVANGLPYQPSFSWIDPSGGTDLIAGATNLSPSTYTGLDQNNDGYFAVTSGLPSGKFRFFGIDYDTVYIGINGFVSFGRGYSAPSDPSGNIPNTLLPNNAIYALHHDIDYSENVTGSKLTYKTVGNDLIITYLKAPYHDAFGTAGFGYVTFQVILTFADSPAQNGDIRVQYNYGLTDNFWTTVIPDNFTHLIGIEGSGGSGTALQYRYRFQSTLNTAGPIFDGSSSLALYFGPGSETLPEEPPPVLSPEISVSAASITGAWGNNYVRSYTVTGVDLSTDISLSVSPSAQFEVSVSEGSGYSDALTVTPASGIVDSTTVYVRTKSAVAAGTALTPATITHSSTGAANRTVDLSGVNYVHYYNTAAGQNHLGSITSWGNGTDGSGANPASFAGNHQVFHIRNATTGQTSVGGNWTVSGADAQIWVEGAGMTFTVAPAETLTVGTGAMVMVDQNSAVSVGGTVVNNSGAPWLVNGTATVVSGGAFVHEPGADGACPPVTFAQGSTLHLRQISSNSTIPAAVGGSVVIGPSVAGDMPGLILGDASTTISGNLTILGGTLYHTDGNLTRALVVGGDMTVVGGEYGVGGKSSGSPSLQVNGMLTVEGGMMYASGDVNGTGKISVKGDIVHTGGDFGAAAGLSNGSIELNGASAQQFSSTGLSGTPSFTFNNRAGVTLGSDVTFPGHVTLADGHLILGASSLTLSGGFTGGADSSHIVTNGLGTVSLSLADAATATFPIGIDASTYNPVMVTNTSGGAAGYEVRVADGLVPVGNGDVAWSARRTWNIAGTGQATLAFTWNTSEAGASLAASPASARAWRYNGSGSWQEIGGTTGAGTPNVTAVTGVTSFSGWTVGGALVVVAPNTAPSFITVPADTTIAEGQTLNVSFGATDADSDPLIYSLISGPAGSSLDSTTAVFTFASGYTSAGEYTVKAGVTDGKAVDTASFRLTVTNVNRAPVFTHVLHDTTISAGATLTFSYAAADADGDVLTYVLLSGPAGASINSTSGAFTWTTSSATIAAVTISVSDGAALDTTRATVTVQSPSLVALIGSGIPEEFSLSPNYPNPFNPSTVIRFGLPGDGHVTITIFDQLGREISTLADDLFGAGVYEARWDASGLASGLYICRIDVAALDGERYTSSRKMMLMR